MRDLLLVLHIVGVATWLGANMVQLISTKRLVAQGGQVAAAWTGMTLLWGRILYMPAAILVLITGSWLVLDSEWAEFSHAFVSVEHRTSTVTDGSARFRVGIALAGSFAVLGMVVIAKIGQRSTAAFGAGDNTAGNAEINKLIPWAVLDTALIVLVIFAMVGKWGV